MNSWQSLREMDRSVWIRFAGETLNGITFMMLMPFFALYLKDSVDSMVQVGLVIAVGPVMATLGSLVGGRISDIFGRKPIMVVSMLGNGITLLGFVFFDGFIAYLFLSAMNGIWNSLFHPAASAMVADVTAEEKRTEAYGLLRMGHNIGAAIGPLIGASVIVFSKETIFLVSASSHFFYCLLLLFMIKETLPKNIQKPKQEEEKQSILRVIINDKLLLFFIVTGIIISMGFTQAEGMLPVHIDNEMNHIFGNNSPYAYMLALNGALVVFCQFQISRWAADKPIGRTMLYGAIFFGIGLLSIGWLPVYFGAANSERWIILVAMLIGMTVLTIGEMVMSPVQMTFVANIAPEHLRGTYMGAAGLQWIVGGALGPLLGGYLLELKQGGLLFSILGIGCMIAGVVYLSIDRLHEKYVKEIQNMEM
ncbi:MAG: MDR family MFS transporter [Bacillaceae bacterium]